MSGLNFDIMQTKQRKRKKEDKANNDPNRTASTPNLLTKRKTSKENSQGTNFTSSKHKAEKTKDTSEVQRKLLILSGDIETNPGPGVPKIPEPMILEESK